MNDVVDARQEEKELVQRVQFGAREPSMIALCRLLELRIQKFQMRMLDCSLEDFIPLQAKAKGAAELLREIKAKQQ